MVTEPGPHSPAAFRSSDDVSHAREDRSATSDGAAQDVGASLGRLLERESARALIVALLVAGAGLVGLGALVGAGGYGSSVLLEVGAALFLAVPLIVVERLLSSRISKAESSIAHVRDDLASVHHDVQANAVRLEELGKATEQRIEANRTGAMEAIDRIRASVSQPNVARALRLVSDLDAVDPRGLRVRLPDSDLRLRFSPLPPGEGAAGDADIRLAIEEADGTPVESETDWTAHEPAEGVLARLATELQRAGRYPGDDSFDARAIFERLVHSLKLAVASRSEGASDQDPGRLTELAYEDWAITSKGFEHMSSGQPAAPRNRLVSNPELALAKLLEHASAPGNQDAFNDGFAAAVEYHRGEDRRRAMSLVSPGSARPPREEDG
jgi:hypothetical protein